MFGVVYGVLIKPLPFHEPNALVSLMHHGGRADLQTLNHGPATYFAALDNQRAFEGGAHTAVNRVLGTPP